MSTAVVEPVPIDGAPRRRAKDDLSRSLRGRSAELELGDLVRRHHHRVPRVPVGVDRDSEGLAASDRLGLGDDAVVRDAGDVALRRLGERDGAAGPLTANLWPALRNALDTYGRIPPISEDGLLA
jgi:hypothetical protein